MERYKGLGGWPKALGAPLLIKGGGWGCPRQAPTRALVRVTVELGVGRSVGVTRGRNSGPKRRRRP